MKLGTKTIRKLKNKKISIEELNENLKEMYYEIVREEIERVKEWKNSS